MHLLEINLQACDYITIVMLLPQAMACIQLSLLKVKCNRCKTFIGNEEDVGMGVVQLYPHEQGMIVHNTVTT